MKHARRGQCIIPDNVQKQRDPPPWIAPDGRLTTENENLNHQQTESFNVHPDSHSTEDKSLATNVSFSSQRKMLNITSRAQIPPTPEHPQKSVRCFTPFVNMTQNVTKASVVVQETETNQNRTNQDSSNIHRSNSIETSNAVPISTDTYSDSPRCVLTRKNSSVNSTQRAKNLLLPARPVPNSGLEHSIKNKQPTKTTVLSTTQHTYSNSSLNIINDSTNNLIEKNKTETSFATSKNKSKPISAIFGDRLLSTKQQIQDYDRKNSGQFFDNKRKEANILPMVYDNSRSSRIVNLETMQSGKITPSNRSQVTQHHLMKCSPLLMSTLNTYGDVNDGRNFSHNSKNGVEVDRRETINENMHVNHAKSRSNAKAENFDSFRSSHHANFFLPPSMVASDQGSSQAIFRTSSKRPHTPPKSNFGQTLHRQSRSPLSHSGQNLEVHVPDSHQHHRRSISWEGERRFAHIPQGQGGFSRSASNTPSGTPKLQSRQPREYPPPHSVYIGMQYPHAPPYPTYAQKQQRQPSVVQSSSPSASSVSMLHSTPPKQIYQQKHLFQRQEEASKHPHTPPHAVRAHHYGQHANRTFSSQSSNNVNPASHSPGSDKNQSSTLSSKFAPRGRSTRSSPPHHNLPHQPPLHHQHRRHSMSNNQSGHSSSGAHTHPVIPLNPQQQNRTSPDILKTLLRKKACLYEADTSRAIALITWLVGRRMALKVGYFSRQQLQLGVHHVVSPKIDAGIITRTKVNRCMQIILNSCFHYIIPRPDGGEERGDAFREQFAGSVKGPGDDQLVKALPAPWNDLDVGTCLDEWLDTLEVAEEEEAGSKRMVLLCFNENVRSSDDVFCCHNEFIRDAANSANLVLTAEEWKLFFAGGSDSSQDANHMVDSTPSTPSIQTAPTASPSNSPRSKATLMEDGIMHAPHLLLPSAQLSPSSSMASSPRSLSPDTVIAESEADEMLGRMSSFELNKFRTTWCSKRYDHDPFRCGFAHVDINRGWLRRDPEVFKYSDKLCPHVSGSTPELENCWFNACAKGVTCKYAHSQEEVDYHPNRYKKKNCPCQTVCRLRDVCPFIHPLLAQKSRVNRFTSHFVSYQSIQHLTSPLSSSRRDGTSAARGSIPKGAPMMYVDAAPTSEFEKSLMLPGLQQLFRQRCATMFALFHGVQQRPYTIF